MKRRLDTLLVERGLADSSEKARALIMAGDVFIDDSVADKAAVQVTEDAPIRLRRKPPFVGRGGLKLDYALDELNVDVESRIALDVGASTGGFTDCLLKRGVAKVYAVDVGYGQLDYRLRTDPRVVAMERVNARHPFPLPEAVDLITIDISFISLEKVVPNVATLMKPKGSILCLVKPQFEARRDQVGKGGVVRDPIVHARVLGRFISWAIGGGFRLGGLAPSPIAGAKGNREFFVLLK